jgi:hypothetical protein
MATLRKLDARLEAMIAWRIAELRVVAAETALAHWREPVRRAVRRGARRAPQFRARRGPGCAFHRGRQSPNLGSEPANSRRVDLVAMPKRN